MELLGYLPRHRYLLIAVQELDPGALPDDSVLAMIARLEQASTPEAVEEEEGQMTTLLDRARQWGEERDQHGSDDPRAGWAEAAQKLEARGDGGLLDEPPPTVFDETEWEWEETQHGKATSI